jgi:hypothetical protein
VGGARVSKDAGRVCSKNLALLPDGE